MDSRHSVSEWYSASISQFFFTLITKNTIRTLSFFSETNKYKLYFINEIKIKE